jgi:hypothetical protein
MKKLTNIDFINKVNIIHNYKYIYDNVEYVSSSKKVKIICKEHGEFEQVANSHLRGIGCSKCSGNNKSNIDEFISKSNLVHQDKYDYSLVEYKGAKNKVKIICREHGEFEQTPTNHMSGQGCKRCGLYKTSFGKTKTKYDFIKESIEIHQDRYDYSLVEYEGTDNKVKIICREHGEFEQSPTKHLQNQGCPTCSESKLEKKIRLLLTNNNIKYIQQYGKKSDYFYLNGQRLDFYLPDYNLGIECQGEQHFRPIDFGNKGEFFSHKMFEKTILRDNNKYNLCKSMNIKILYFCKKENYKNKYIGEIFYKDYDIINKIKNS